MISTARAPTYHQMKKPHHDRIDCPSSSYMFHPSSPRYLSNIWYIPPGIGLIIEMIIEIIILRKATVLFFFQRPGVRP